MEKSLSKTLLVGYISWPRRSWRVTYICLEKVNQDLAVVLYSWPRRHHLPETQAFWNPEVASRLVGWGRDLCNGKLMRPCIRGTTNPERENASQRPGEVVFCMQWWLDSLAHSYASQRMWLPCKADRRTRDLVDWSGDQRKRNQTAGRVWGSEERGRQKPFRPPQGQKTGSPERLSP